jgi:hypothetical protein
VATSSLVIPKQSEAVEQSEQMKIGPNMKRLIPMALVSGGMLLQACAPAATPEQQAQRQHEIACTAGTITGALIGGAIGSQFGGGTGQDILIATGAAAGAAGGNNYSC